mgnify:CR=1 FL=1
MLIFLKFIKNKIEVFLMKEKKREVRLICCVYTSNLCLCQTIGYSLARSWFLIQVYCLLAYCQSSIASLSYKTSLLIFS